MSAPFQVRAALEHKNIEPGRGTIWAAIRIAAQGPALEAERAPLAVALVVDVSGSMRGDPLDNVLQSCEQIVNSVLGTNDELAIVTFSDHAGVLCGLTVMNDAGRAQLRAALRAAVAGGSTNLHEGLAVAAGVLQQARAGLRRTLVVLSDGKPNRGLQSAAQLASYVGSLGMAVSSLGFGDYYHEDVLEAIATAGSGRHLQIKEPALARADLARAVQAQGDVVADRLELRLRPSPGVEVLQVLPTSSLRVGSDGLTTFVGDVFKDEARAFAVELQVDLGNDMSGKLLEIAVDGRSPGSSGSHTASATLGIDIRAGARVVDSEAQRGIVTLQADAARVAARAHADRGAMPSAASTLRDAIAHIDAVAGFVRNDGSMLAELREQLQDQVTRYERRATHMERTHHRKADVAYKPASPFFERPARAKPAVSARLLGVGGPVSGESYPLWTETIIGRSPRCDIAIHDESVSRNHVRIQFLDDHFLLVDLGAATGTHINGQLTQSARLADGDVIQVGDAVLRFESPVPRQTQQTLPGMG